MKIYCIKTDLNRKVENHQLKSYKKDLKPYIKMDKETIKFIKFINDTEIKVYKFQYRNISL